MRINLNQEAYDCIDTVIGKICVFGINVKSQTDLHKKLGQPISDCDPEEFVRLLSIYICFPEASLKEGKYKPDSPVIREEEANSLTTNDVEQIAEIYIRNNEYLFKKLEFKKRKNDKGETVHYGEYSDIEFPKDENESYTEYLHRLSAKEEIKQRKRMEKLFKSVSGLSSFSSSLSESIKNTLSWGDSLRKTMGSIRPIQQATIRPVEMRFPETDWADIERRKEERRLKPFKDLSEKLDQLIDSSMQASEFMIEANRIQTRIAGEIKASGDITTRFSKRNIILSIIIITISAIGLTFSVYSRINENTNKESKQLSVIRNLNEISQKISDLNESIAGNNINLSVSVEKLLKELKQSVIKENEYKELVKEQVLIIEGLKKSNNQHKEMLKKLEYRMRSIENTNKPE